MNLSDNPKNLRQKKNGILLVKPKIEKDEELSYKFHDTGEFEVNCICLINQSEYKNNTFFFFAGGLDTVRRLGMIKLFTAMYNQEKNRFNIAYLQDIETEEINEFEGFETSIDCILQNKNDGKILVCSSDGKINAFSEPNLKYYIENYEEKIAHLFEIE